jgi:hypothetical protein
MITASIRKSFAHQLDKLVLYAINRRVPDSLEDSYRDAQSLETVLSQTSVDLHKTDEPQLTAPGEHRVWLNTMGGELVCHVRVRLAADSRAPLLLYHHGLNEIPYTSSWRRIFRQPAPFPAHTVCVQAPFHSNWIDPIRLGFASIQNMYQMLAGSLRIMELLQSRFESHGAACTVAAGISWGGITSLMYEGLFQRTRAVIPMLASPNLARAIWDIATILNRPMSMSQTEIAQHLDFTPYYRRCESSLVFPLMGENDLFFRLENHSDLFEARPLITIPGGHITGYWRARRLRRHVLDVLASLKRNP